MSKRRNLAWLRVETSRIVNFNQGQPDQDFDGTSDDAWDEIDAAINEAYENLLHDMIAETDPDMFMVNEELTWSSGDLTYQLPEHLEQDNLEWIEDITSSDPGDIVWVHGRGINYYPDVLWKDYRTLQWGTSGPSGDRSLRFHHMARAADMKQPEDIPEYVPARFRKILAWDAAIILRTEAEDEAPSQWLGHRNAVWEKIEILLSQGRPRLTNRARIVVDRLEDDHV